MSEEEEEEEIVEFEFKEEIVLNFFINMFEGIETLDSILTLWLGILLEDSKKENKKEDWKIFFFLLTKIKKKCIFNKFIYKFNINLI